MFDKCADFRLNVAGFNTDMILRPDQEEVTERLREGYRKGAKRQILVAETGFGKCLGAGTPVMLFSGQVVPVEQIAVGDMLMGPDSAPRRVLSLCKGYGDLYKVNPTKGDSYVVNSNHILTLRMTGGSRPWGFHGKHVYPNQVLDVSIDDWITSTKTFRWCAKGFRVPVDFHPQYIHPDLPPYILGLWLGDGISLLPAIVSADLEIQKEVSIYAKSIGLNTRIEYQNTNKSVVIHVSNLARGKENRFISALRRLNLLGNKHVPNAYKINVRSVRLEMLAGLLDSDGYCNAGCFDFVSQSKCLADDVAFLSRSLGLAAYVSPCIKRCCNNGVVGQYYRVIISGDTHLVPCRLPRKQAAKRRIVKNALNVGISVSRAGHGTYHGFELDGDGRFLLGDFTVTHNSVTAAFYTKSALSKGLRVLICTHRGEILDQLCRTLDAVGVQNATIEAGERMFPRIPVQVASIPTLIRRFDKIKAPDLVILDEVAHCVSKTWASIFAQYPQAYFLGLTATPERLDGRGLGEFFEAIVQGPSMAWLIERNLLARPRYFGVAPSSAPDTSGLHKVAGDFNRGESADLMDKPAITGDAVEHYRRLCPDRTAIAFTVSLKHAEHVCQQFHDAGITARCIDGTMTKDQRRAIIDSLRSGATRVLVSVDLVSEGFDLPAVGAAILLRPTASLALHRQQCGRTLRMAPGKTCSLILDHVGNTLRHGPVEEPIEWTLEGGAAKKRAKERPVETQQCPSCYAIFSGPACPQCGAIREIKPRKIDQRSGVLREMSAEEIAEAREAKERRMEEGRCRSLEEFQAIARARGYKPAWAFMRWQLKRKYLGPTHDAKPTLRQEELIPAIQ